LVQTILYDEKEKIMKRIRKCCQTGLLLLMLLLTLPVLTGCSQGGSGGEVTTTITTIDENGNVTTTTRVGKAKNYDTGMLFTFGAVEVVILAIGYVHYRRANELTAMGKRCYKEVPATIIQLRKNKGDRGLRMRNYHYNATYSYRYLGREYESSNQVYGRRGKKGLAESLPFEGEDTTISINPEDPYEIFDELTEGMRDIYWFSFTLDAICALAMVGLTLKLMFF